MGAWRYSFTVLDVGIIQVSCQLYAPARITPGEIAHGTHWIGGRVGPEPIWAL
jgi:hypothetical protein